MLLPIITEPNPILHKKAAAVEPADIGGERLQQLITNLIETMRSGNGAGIAAPQTGESLCLCLIAKEHNPTDKEKELVLINPRWEKSGLFKSWDEEGCLSVPNIYGQVKRYKKIKVRALDAHGREMNFSAEDFLARVIQHEVDHLEGILFIDKAKDLREVKEAL